MWYYEGKEFNSEDIGDAFGMVYLITEKETGKKYIGQKRFWSTRKLAPLKGQKRRRTKITESDWKDYFGSSENVKLLVEEKGPDAFHREILHLCHSKGELNYIELWSQVKHNVLLDENYYNGIIQVRINATHLRTLKEKVDRGDFLL